MENVPRCELDPDAGYEAEQHRPGPTQVLAEGVDASGLSHQRFGKDVVKLIDQCRLVAVVEQVATAPQQRQASHHSQQLRQIDKPVHRNRQGDRDEEQAEYRQGAGPRVGSSSRDCSGRPRMGIDSNTAGRSQLIRDDDLGSKPAGLRLWEKRVIWGSSHWQVHVCTSWIQLSTSEQNAGRPRSYT